MKTISKALVGTVAAGAMAMTSAAPAFARDRNSDGISTGEVIAGAVILGGVAAILASSGNNRNHARGQNYNGAGGYRNPGNYRGGNNYRDTGRRAVEQCIAAATQDARRAGYRQVQVTQIRDVDSRHDGWRVKGEIMVGNSNGYQNQGNYRGYDRRSNFRNNSRSDTGTFKCDFSRGSVTYLGFNSVRGL